MAYMIAFHWGWLLAALVLGFCMGWVAVVTRARSVSKRWLIALSVLAAALVAAAVLQVVPGRFGYWLDLLLLMFAPYLIGCAVGTQLRAWVVMRAMARARG